jgi:hypothetical protein
MAKPQRTKALESFDVNIRRPRALLDMFDAGSLKPEAGDRRTVGKPSWQENELLRAAVIVAVGTLDAYLSDVAAEILVAQLQRGWDVRASAEAREQGRLVLRRVIKEIDTLPLELALLSDPADRASAAAEAIRHYLDNQVSNHGAKGVAATLGRIGAEIDWQVLDARVPEAARRSTDKQGAAAALDAWTKRRHELVHQGKALKIKAGEARAVTDLVEIIARQVDALAIATK